MIEEHAHLQQATDKQPWTEAWFFLALLAVLFWNADGLSGAVTGFVCLKFLEPRLPFLLAMVAAIAMGGTVALLAAKWL